MRRLVGRTTPRSAPRALARHAPLALVLAAACGRVPDHATEPAMQGVACMSCHTDRYAATTEPPHAALGYPTACETCHTTEDWEPSTWPGHDQWMLTGKHLTTTCASCHEGADFTAAPTACVGCHRPDYDASASPVHSGPDFPTTCETCHTTADWRDASFDHDDWPLRGKHLTTTCAGCHEGGVYAGTPTTCDGCHDAAYRTAPDPSHVALALPKTCETCHTEAGWAPAAFPEHDPIWRIDGRHQGVGCASCHTSGYTGTPKECVGCHEDDFLATTAPSHAAAGYPDTCTTCHTTAGWQPATFDHTGWPLRGQHAATSCAGCHEGGVYAGTPKDCDACHHDDFQGAADPNHVALALPTACAGCHSEAGWKPADIGAHDRFWPIDGKHTPLDCASCHSQGYAGTARECVGCHQDDYATVTEPNHVAAAYPLGCPTCHTTAGWSPSGFEHTTWPLRGKHQTATCTTCHVNGVYAGTPKGCASCHEDDFLTAVDPDHVGLALSTSCGGCHSESGWRPADAGAHDRYWRIEGKHTDVACASCHQGGVYTGTPRTCEGCHFADYDTARAPDHLRAGLPTACAGCHQATGWTPAGFVAHDTLWPLEGQHATATCASCHQGEVYAGTPKECVGCHEPDYVATTDPAHDLTGYPATCEGCHDASAWRPSTFDHADTWPLLGQHAAETCVACHAGDVFSGTPRECDGCHLAKYEATTAPDHVADAFPTECGACHGSATWRPASFTAHDQYWPLQGQHVAATCVDCHAGSTYPGTPRTCDGCHRPDYVASVDPAHALSGYPKTCEGCHDATGWRPSSFAHGAYWPLAGRHATATCTSCHQNEVFTGTPMTCDGCHDDDYTASTAPAHAAAGFPRACEQCHTASAWAPSSFDHAATWPLAGQHATATCASCHSGGVFEGTPRACDGCHDDDYVTTTDPAHGAAGFAKTCESCHSAAAWTPSSFDHQTYWPLTGQHQTTDCASCHTGPTYAGTPTACDGCHRPDYLATTTPAHGASGIPATCEVCHSTAAWQPSSFNHQTVWPLTGQHATATCIQCHANGYVAGAPRPCVSCHQPDYAATTNPPHGARAVSLTCQTCHTTASWATNLFPGHNAIFPLTNDHGGYTCQACHKTPTWSAFICVNCHTGDHTIPRVTAQHNEVATYNATVAQYGLDRACLHCHPTGTSPD